MGENDYSTSNKDDFATRVRHVIGAFRPHMRRSLQNVLLYEANRCLQSRYPRLKPYQRKFALYLTMLDLLRELDVFDERSPGDGSPENGSPGDGLSEEYPEGSSNRRPSSKNPSNKRSSSDRQRLSVLYRTMSSKTPICLNLAWRRMRILHRQLNSQVLDKMRVLLGEGSEEGNGGGGGRNKSHEELCRLFLQRQFQETTQSHKPFPSSWEYTHLHVFLTYRIYYRGLSLDPHIFPPIPPRIVNVPTKKPANMHQVALDVPTTSKYKTASDDRRQHQHAAGNNQRMHHLHHQFTNPIRPHKLITTAKDERRRAMLREVKDYTELLSQFEGIVPQNLLLDRKRSLYMALPPVPFHHLQYLQTHASITATNTITNDNAANDSMNGAVANTLPPQQNTQQDEMTMNPIAEKDDNET